MVLTLHGLIKAVDEERRGAGDHCQKQDETTKRAKFIGGAEKHENEKAGICVNAGRK